MTTAETLRAARELIVDPEHWCQDALARGKGGRPVNLGGRAAVAWSAEGAIYRAAGGAGAAFEAFVCFDRAVMAVGGDHRTHADVLAMFDRAIKEAE